MTTSLIMASWRMIGSSCELAHINSPLVHAALHGVDDSDWATASIFSWMAWIGWSEGVYGGQLVGGDRTSSIFIRRKPGSKWHWRRDGRLW